MTYDTIDESRKSEATERRTSLASTRHGAPRGSAEAIAKVRSVGTSSISISRGSRTARRPGRGGRGDDTHYPQTSARHRAYPAPAGGTQRHDYRCARRTSSGRVYKRVKRAWLSGAKDAPPPKSPSTIRLIDCSSRSSRRSTLFWSPD